MTAATAIPWPTEPPLAGSADEQVIATLDRLRATFRWKAGGLGEAGLGASIGASALTLGGLLKHLTAVESVHTLWKCFGEDPGAPWNTHDWEADPDWPFTSAAEDSPAELYANYDEAVARSRQRLATALPDGGLDQVVRASDGQGNHANLRRMVCDLIEEYGRHAGHADLLREAVDGLVGEDVPQGWQPG